MTMALKSERLDALHILLQVVQNKQPLTYLLQKPSVTPLTKTLCFGVMRQYIRLEMLALKLLKKRPKDMSVWLCILLGIYQLEILQTPAYAAVQETVHLLTLQKKTWAKGLVNAVLRRYCREHTDIKAGLEGQLDYHNNHPLWFVKQLQQAWPNHWNTILEANDSHPPLSLRVNTARHSREQYGQRLSQLGLSYTIIPETLDGLILTTPCNVRDIPGFMDGEVSVQDGAAQLAGSLLQLNPGCRVLDACCAPGGKLGHILELGAELQTCIGIDVSAERLKKVQDNCQRLHLNARLIAADALQPDAWWDGVLFDRILLDAPCSATGIIRRHPDIKYLRTEQEIHILAQLQQKLLATLWPLLAPEGILIYATCSVLPEENEQRIATFLKDHPDAKATTHSQAWGISTGHGWQILPGQHNLDGFFYAQLRKV